MCSDDGYTDVYNTLDKCELCSDELPWYTANEDHTGCKIHMGKFIPLVLTLLLFLFSVVYHFIRRRLRNANARVATLKRKVSFVGRALSEQRERVSIVGKELKKEKEKRIIRSSSL